MTDSHRAGFQAFVAATIIGAALAGCSAAPTEQEATMTPDAAEQALIELMTSTREVMGLDEAGWDPEFPLAPDPCALSNDERGINFVDVRTWTGDTEADAVIAEVQQHWEEQGLTTSIRDQSNGGHTLMRLIGRDGPVENIRVTIAPGQVSLDGESICVVGEL